MLSKTRECRYPLRWSGFWVAIGWLLIAAVVFLTLTPSPPHIDVLANDKLRHGLSYAVLMFWFCQIYLPLGHWRIAIQLVLLGIALEILQGISGFRQFEYLDMLANAGGVLVGWALSRMFRGTLLLRLEQLAKLAR